MADARKPAAAPQRDDGVGAKPKPAAAVAATKADDTAKPPEGAARPSGKGPKGESADGDKGATEKAEKEKEKIVKERDMLRYKMIMEEEKVDGNLDDEARVRLGSYRDLYSHLRRSLTRSTSPTTISIRLSFAVPTAPSIESLTPHRDAHHVEEGA